MYQPSNYCQESKYKVWLQTKCGVLRNTLHSMLYYRPVRVNECCVDTTLLSCFYDAIYIRWKQSAACWVDRGELKVQISVKWFERRALAGLRRSELMFYVCRSVFPAPEIIWWGWTTLWCVKLLDPKQSSFNHPNPEISNQHSDPYLIFNFPLSGKIVFFFFYWMTIVKFSSSCPAAAATMWIMFNQIFRRI